MLEKGDILFILRYRFAALHHEYSTQHLDRLK
jgi:hypothetical protein